ncbi:hypothetical protein WKW50_22130 [Ochrobactrum sp. GPK 3]
MKETLPEATVQDILDCAPKLYEWTAMAAVACGTYMGANNAIAKTEDRSSPGAHMADEIRNQMIMMAVIRCFAILDRSAKFSFQLVHRFLKHPSNIDALVTEVTKKPTDGSIPHTESLCRLSVKQFTDIYSTIDFKALSKLQRFRNDAIAHVSLRDIQRIGLTYDEVIELVKKCCLLSKTLNLAVAGNNADPLKYFDGAIQDAQNFWHYAVEYNW